MGKICVFFYLLWLVLIWTGTHLFGFMIEIWNQLNHGIFTRQLTKSNVVTTVPGGPGGAPPILAPAMEVLWEHPGKI